MEENSVKIELLPKGAFLITIGEQHIKGRFSMYALDRFCEQKGVDSYLTLIEKITIGMTIKDYAELMVVAFQDYYREDTKQCPWSASLVMDDIIDNLGGVASPDFMKLCRHAIGRVATLKETPADASAQASDETKEKKSPLPGEST